MNKSRQSKFVLHALAGLIGLLALSSVSAQPRFPARYSVPNGFTRVAAVQMFDTMDGHKNVIDWDCYAPFDTAKNKPASRTVLWLVGKLKWTGGYATDLNVFDIGAQHRTHVVHLRLGSKKPSPKAEVWQLVEKGSPVHKLLTPDAEGFYLIEEGLPSGGTNLYNKYVIRTDDPVLQLEAYFDSHPPLANLQFFQIEDGGPPSVPPVNEN